MSISQDGIDLIAELEGFRDKPYNDIAGNSTIGYGTLLHRGNVDCLNNPLDKQYQNGISMDEAAQLLRVHVRAEVEPVINSAVRVSLKQNQFDALCSFVYNIGAGAFEKSTLVKVLNLGGYDAVPEQMRKWVMAGGQVSPGLNYRRSKEIDLWIKS